MKYKNLEIQRLYHATFRISAVPTDAEGSGGQGKTIYFDPFKVGATQPPGDLVLVTHEHFDHFSPEDLAKVTNGNTFLVLSKSIQGQLPTSVKAREVKYVGVGEEFEAEGIKVRTVAAYNIDKFRSPGVPFHPNDGRYVGYILTIDGVTVYHAGDTDNIPEMKEIKGLDVAFLPVSGTYVMTWEEAVVAAKILAPKLAIPSHYSDVVGSVEDAKNFKENCDCPVEII